jgi:MFS family permease
MRRLAVLMAAAFVDMLGFAMIFPLLPFYALRLNAEEWVIGWMIASFSIVQLASSPLWGRMSDKLGRRSAILFGLGTSAIAFVVFGFAASIWMLFLSRIVQGFGGGTTGVLQAYVADVTEPRDRAKALGWLSAATGVGVMIGPAIGSLAFKMGHAAPGMVAAALCLVNIVFAWRWLPESYPEHHRAGAPAVPDRAPRGIRTMIVDVLSTPGSDISRLIWIYAGGMLGFMSMTAVLALYLASDFGITEESIFIFFVYLGGIGVIMRASPHPRARAPRDPAATLGRRARADARARADRNGVPVSGRLRADLAPSRTPRAGTDARGATGIRRRLTGPRPDLVHGGVPGTRRGHPVLPVRRSRWAGPADDPGRAA